jgi:hypothetical protein
MTDMAQVAGKPASTLLSSLLAPALDIIVLGSFIWLIPLLIIRLTDQHWLNAALIVAVYFAMCGGVLLLKLIKPSAAQRNAGARESDVSPANTRNGTEEAPNPADWSPRDTRGCATALSVFFSLFMVAIVVDTSGVFSGDAAWSTHLERFWQEQSWVALPLGLGILFVVCALPAAMLANPRPRISATSLAGVIAKTAGVLSINAMVLVTAAYWEAQAAGSEPLELALGGRILVFLIVYVVMVLFYAPPRLVLLSIDPAPWSLPTFLLMLGIIVWLLLF